MNRVMPLKTAPVIIRVLIFSLTAVLSLAACDKDGAGEKAGKKIDQAADNVKQSIEQSADSAKLKIDAAKDNLSLKTDQAQAKLSESTDQAKAALTQAGQNVEASKENAEQKIEQLEDNAGKELAVAKDAVEKKAETSASYVDDSVITLKVKAAILDDVAFKASVFEVTTVNGVVTLKGTVDSEQNKIKVIDLVQRLEHVKAVQTDLVVNAIPLSK